MWKKQHNIFLSYLKATIRIELKSKLLKIVETFAFLKLTETANNFYESFVIC
jgi:hypothetical protein